MTPGLHLLHKPAGPTSFSLVQSAIAGVKAAAPNRRPRVCHGGTLDPFAHGLLLMLVGLATSAVAGCRCCTIEARDRPISPAFRLHPADYGGTLWPSRLTFCSLGIWG